MNLSENTYENRRRWGDAFIPSMNQMAAELLMQNSLITPAFQTPTVYADQKQGIDMYCDWDRVKLAYRTRKYSDLHYYKEGFTLRRSGGDWSELNKVLAGIHADYMLYTVAQPEGDGLFAGVLIDLKSVAVQLNTYPGVLHEAIHQANFVDLAYTIFPQNVVVGSFGESVVTRLQGVH